MVTELPSTSLSYFLMTSPCKRQRKYVTSAQLMVVSQIHTRENLYLPHTATCLSWCSSSSLCGYMPGARTQNVLLLLPFLCLSWDICTSSALMRTKCLRGQSGTRMTRTNLYAQTCNAEYFTLALENVQSSTQRP